MEALGGRGGIAPTLVVKLIIYNLYVYIYKVKQSRYTPWRLLGGEEV
jgi:hypothetical protein